MAMANPTSPPVSWATSPQSSPWPSCLETETEHSRSVYNPTGDADGEVTGVSVADFNRDGKTDLALADNQNISILLSNGDGTFTLAASTTGATTFPSYLSSATGDFNGDGVPDITVADG